MKKLLAWTMVFAFAAGALATTATAQEKKQRDPEAQFKRLDKNNDGKLSVEEFVGKREAEQADRAKAQFKRLDKDEDGFLSLEEFKARGRKKSDN